MQNWRVANLLADPNVQIDHKMIITPDDNCVNYSGGAAWGQVYRTITWVQSRVALFPIVQVHEFGHNLGMKVREWT